MFATEYGAEEVPSAGAPNQVRVHRRERASTATGPGGDLLFVLGWGNRPDHPAVDWLLDRLAAEWTVHAVVLPENGTDFERDYLAPLRAVDDRVDPDVRAGHSLGGLTLAHLPGDDPRAYSAPFWGLAAPGPVRLVVGVVGRLPVSRRVIPLAVDPEDLGEYADADRDRAADRGCSPAWLGAVRRAQATLPPRREGSVVYCSLRESVVSLAAIGRRTPQDRVRLYDGGHEFFASRGRSETVERFRADLRALAER